MNGHQGKRKLTPIEEQAVAKAIRFARAHGLEGELILRRGSVCGTLYLDHLTNAARNGVPALKLLAEIEVGKEPLNIQNGLVYGVKGRIKSEAVMTYGGQRGKRLFQFQPMSAQAGGASKPSWRSFKPHPAAEVFHKRSTPEQLRELADDIKANGLKVPIQTRTVAGEPHPYVIDGISRLDAMEKLLGWEIVDEKGNWKGVLASPPGAKPMVDHREGYTHEQIASEVIAFNAKRRHQTKQELVDDIDDALRAVESMGRTDHAKIAQSVESRQPVRAEGGKLAGSTKGHTGKVVEKAKEAGISESTTRHRLAQRRAADLIKRDGKPPPTRKPKPKEVDKTSDYFITKRFLTFIDYWPVTQQRAVRRKLREMLLGRVERKDGNEHIVLPEFVIWSDGKKQKLEDVVGKADASQEKAK
jgi:hypothetical protein